MDLSWSELEWAGVRIWFLWPALHLQGCPRPLLYWGKRDTTRNISCSISFSSTFHVLYCGNIYYFLDSVGYSIPWLSLDWPLIGNTERRPGLPVQYSILSSMNYKMVKKCTTWSADFSFVAFSPVINCQF